MHKMATKRITFVRKYFLMDVQNSDQNALVRKYFLMDPQNDNKNNSFYEKTFCDG